MTEFGEALREVRQARGLSLRGLGRLVHYSHGYLHALEQGQKPSSPQLASRLDRALDARGALVRAATAAPSVQPAQASAPLHEAAFLDLVEWLDEAAGWACGAAEERVRAYLAEFDHLALRDRARQRGKVQRRDVASVLNEFYRLPAEGFRAFTAYVDNKPILTSILGRPEWINLGLQLGMGCDRLDFRDLYGATFETLDQYAADAAARRIAEMSATGTRLVDKPLYRLHRLDIQPGQLHGSVSLTNFARYALTLDLLEHEVLDAAHERGTAGAITFPLRERYLPSLEAIVALDDRLCVGGPLALFAAARPGSRYRPDEPDYVLLIQQRSGRVLNATNRLAVIPKSFHEPMVDLGYDAQLSSTLEREMEEELFGRADVDATIQEQRQADPYHASRLSAPMRWLAERPETWRMECTGFGFNLVSGNYEFASLIVVEDDDWWVRFGGHIEANWETEGLRRYSSRDRDGLAHLMHDGSWSNEGVFALLLGLRRLGESGGRRVRLPEMRVG